MDTEDLDSMIQLGKHEHDELAPDQTTYPLHGRRDRP